MLIRCEMRFKEAELNILVILLEVLQGNLGVGVEVVPVKQVLVYQVVIRLVVSMGMGRMDMREIQQVVDNHMVEVFPVVEDFPAVEDSQMVLVQVDFRAAFLEVFLVEDLEVVDPLVLVVFLADPLVEVVDQVAMEVVSMEGNYQRGWVD